MDPYFLAYLIFFLTKNFLQGMERAMKCIYKNLEEVILLPTEVTQK